MNSPDALTRVVLGPLARRSELAGVEPSAGSQRLGVARPKPSGERAPMRALARLTEGEPLASVPAGPRPSEVKTAPTSIGSARAGAGEGSRIGDVATPRPRPVTSERREPDRPAPRQPTSVPTSPRVAPARPSVVERGVQRERVIERVIERVQPIVRGRPPRTSKRRSVGRPLVLRSEPSVGKQGTSPRPSEAARVERGSLPRTAEPRVQPRPIATPVRRELVRASGPSRMIERKAEPSTGRKPTRRKPKRASVEPNKQVVSGKPRARRAQAGRKREPKPVTNQVASASKPKPTASPAPTPRAKPERQAKPEPKPTPRSARKRGPKPEAPRPRPVEPVARRASPPPPPRIAVAIGRIEIRSKTPASAGKPSAARAAASPRAHAIAIALPGAL